MDDDDALYCKVYVKGAADVAALQALLAECTQGQAVRRNVKAPPLDIDVFDQGRHAPADAGDDFVRWPAYLEVGAVDPGTGFAAYLAALAQLVAALRSRGLQVVASCAFEDELAQALQTPGT